jgi:hypothetical protein
MALADFFTRPSSEAPTEGGLSADLADRLEQAKAAYQKQYGKPMPITSGFRTKEQQQRLFDERKNNPNLVAAPGTSLHETGNAVDIGTTVPEAFLNQFGIHRPLGKKDPVHAVLMPVEKPSEGGLASFFTRPEGEQAPKEQDLTKPFVGYRPMRRPGVAEAQQPGSPEAQQANQERGKETSFLRDLALGGASLADMTVGGILPMAGQVTQAGARFLGGAEQMLTGKPSSLTPQRAEQIGGAVTSALDKPFGKTLGAMGVGQGTESPAYKQELFRSTMDAFAEKGIEPTAEAIAQATKMPIEDVRNMLGTAMIGVAPTVGKYGKKGFDVAREVVGDVRSQMQQQFAARQGQPGVQPGGMQSAGAAATQTPEMMRGNVNAALSNASPELQAHISAQPVERVNVPALETRSLEEKHGVNLLTSQRIGDTTGYSEAWNQRGKNGLVGDFEQQPKQLAQAFEQSKARNAPRIPAEVDASELGQHQINGLAEKDAMRVQNIDKAYQDFRDKYVELKQQQGMPVENDFPVDGKAFLQNANKALINESLQFEVPKSLKDLLDHINEKDGKLSFSEFINLDKRLSAKTREGTGSERQAAFVIRQELQKIPLLDEAAALEPMYRNAVSLAKERFDVIKSNPAYRKAIGEAADLKEASSQGESLNAAKFHKQFVSDATPEAIRRMKAEMPEDHIGLEAMTVGELERAKRAITNANESRVKADTFADFLRKNKSSLRETLPPDAMQDVMEIGLLNSKIGKPEAGTFNYSNSFSALIGDLAKQSLLSAAEAKLAGATGGLSIFPVSGAKAMMQKFNKDAFANEQRNPYGGLVRDGNNPPKPVKIDLSGMANKE